MLTTIVVLIVDWIVLRINGQTLLGYHALYIAMLVFRLWRYRQPESYTLRLGKEKTASKGGE